MAVEWCYEARSFSFFVNLESKRILFPNRRKQSQGLNFPYIFENLRSRSAIFGIAAISHTGKFENARRIFETSD